MRPKNGKFGCTLCQRSKESSSRGKRKRLVFICRRTLRVKVKSKVIPTNSLIIERRGRSLGRKTGERGRIVELVGSQKPSTEAPPMSKKRESKVDITRRATARGPMEKSRYVWFNERKQVKEMIQWNTSSPLGSEVRFESQRA